MSKCGTNPEDHCCWFGDKPCPYLERLEGPKFFWSCKLRRTLGSWEAVHADKNYIRHIKPRWDAAGIPDCGDWPTKTKHDCNACGEKHREDDAAGSTP